MLQVFAIRDDREKVVKGLKKRRLKSVEESLDTILSLDQKRRQTQQQQDTLLAESNSLAKEIGALMKAGKKDDAEKMKARTAELKKQISELGPVLTQSEEELQKLLYAIPNVPHESVPDGGGPDDNIKVHEWGTIPTLGKDAVPHWDLIKKYDIIDFDLGNKIAGAGFPVYKGKGAKLQRALINFFLDEADKQGYREIQPYCGERSFGLWHRATSRQRRSDVSHADRQSLSDSYR
jgi:seryl-tRNA synthetase